MKDVVIYRSNNDVIVTTKSEEQHCIEEFFKKGNRDIEEYKREEPSTTFIFTTKIKHDITKEIGMFIKLTMENDIWLNMDCVEFFTEDKKGGSKIFMKGDMGQKYDLVEETPNEIMSKIEKLCKTS